MAAARKENALEDVALVAGTQQNLSNLYSLDIFGNVPVGQIFELVKSIGAMPRSFPRPALQASQVSNSPIFYERLFVRKLFAQLFSAYNLGL
jgi:hypothetical protein